MYFHVEVVKAICVCSPMFVASLHMVEVFFVVHCTQCRPGWKDLVSFLLLSVTTSSGVNRESL